MTAAFIAFEGCEGAGKSTQEQLLAQYLMSAGHEVLRTREPGGTPAAEAIRAVVLDPRFIGLDPKCEALLFAAARAEHVSKVIAPALGRSQIVICDRYIDSSVAYQGYARELGPAQIADISSWATAGLWPDLTFVLDIDPRVGLGRIEHPDRMEAEPLDFHHRVRAGFLDMARTAGERAVVIDASASVQDIAAQVRGHVDSLLDAR